MSDLARQARLPPRFANTPVKPRQTIAAASDNSHSNMRSEPHRPEAACASRTASCRLGPRSPKGRPWSSQGRAVRQAHRAQAHGDSHKHARVGWNVGDALSPNDSFAQDRAKIAKLNKHCPRASISTLSYATNDHSEV